jgi:alpha-D-ribose 1-methylphosphonate 5-triphosphate diphosphatase
MQETRFANARVVTRDADFTGGIVVADGHIVAAEPNLAVASATEDCEGDFLIPGLIDIHTDNLERHYSPRPGTHSHPLVAVLAHDGQMASAGITTIFDSLSLHGEKHGLDRDAALKPMISGVVHASEENILRADHYLHLRCEVTNAKLIETLEPHLDNPLLKLLSVMDHTPGQRQYRNFGVQELRPMLVADGRSEREIEDIIAEWQSVQLVDKVIANRAAVIAAAREYHIPLASHDDETAEQVVEAAADGVSISEFPVTIEAAEEARRQGVAVFMGAPNLVRGGSHTGNISASDVALAGCLDGMASDYVPISMLRAAFQLTAAPFDMSLSAAIATVTLTPARSVGLLDRGEIAPGKRADLVRVGLSRDGWPIVRGVWRKGRRVA